MPCVVCCVLCVVCCVLCVVCCVCFFNSSSFICMCTGPCTIFLNLHFYVHFGLFHVSASFMFRPLSCFGLFHVSASFMFRPLSCFGLFHVSASFMFRPLSCFGLFHVSASFMFFCRFALALRAEPLGYFPILFPSV